MTVKAPSASTAPTVDRGALRDIIEEHIEELTILWHIRASRTRSSQHRLIDLIRLDERVDAHADAIALAGGRAAEWLRDNIHSDDRAAVFTSVHCALRGEMAELLPEIWPAFAACSPDNAAGFAEAVAHAPGSAWVTPVIEVTRGESLAGVVAFEVLARRELLPSRRPEIGAFIHSPVDEIRLWAWRAARFDLDVPDSAWKRGADETSAPLRWAVIEAEAWRGRPGLIQRLQSSALEFADDLGVRALALLAGPEHAESVNQAILRLESLQSRCAALGAWGHPSAIPLLMALLSHEDQRTASSAGVALTRITAWDLDGQQTVELPPEDAAPDDEFARAFDETVVLPDPEKARALWRTDRKRFEGGARWSRGVDLSRGFETDQLGKVDLESLLGTCLRSRMTGQKGWRPARLEGFPQPRI